MEGCKEEWPGKRPFVIHADWESFCEEVVENVPTTV
jgi:hypothetical protein